MSDKVDAWVKKELESWSKLAENTKQGDSFDSFKKKFLKGARNNGKYSAVKHMTNAQILSIYNASGLSNTTIKTVKQSTQKAFAPTKIKVKRKGKTYTRTASPRWSANTSLAITIASKAKPGSQEYKQYVKNIVASTGRTRQAVVKKIQRTRRTK